MICDCLFPSSFSPSLWRCCSVWTMNLSHECAFFLPFLSFPFLSFYSCGWQDIPIFLLLIMSIQTVELVFKIHCISQLLVGSSCFMLKILINYFCSEWFCKQNLLSHVCYTKQTNKTVPGDPRLLHGDLINDSNSNWVQACIRFPGA
jgi:hypothetical protein